MYVDPINASKPGVSLLGSCESSPTDRNTVCRENLDKLSPVDGLAHP